MRFLKLLDPKGVVAEGPGLTIAEQAARAREQFPSLVAESPFTYWRRGDPIANTAVRLLVGVCPTFDLGNLRMLDLLSDKLRSEFPEGLRFDICDLDDMQEWSSAMNYFPGLSSMVPNPIVGIWTFGRHIVNYWGGQGTEYLLTCFDLKATPLQLAQSVSPPAKDMFE